MLLNVPTLVRMASHRNFATQVASRIQEAHHFISIAPSPLHILMPFAVE